MFHDMLYSKSHALIWCTVPTVLEPVDKCCNDIDGKQPMLYFVDFMHGGELFPLYVMGLYIYCACSCVPVLTSSPHQMCQLILVLQPGDFYRISQDQEMLYVSYHFSLSLHLC